MTEWLTRAWDVLEEGERPKGMCGGESCGLDGPDWTWWEPGNGDMTINAARDRLIVAVEDVLYEMGLDKHQGHWGRWHALSTTPEWFARLGDDISDNPDRLAAAVLALEVMRKRYDPST